MNKHLSKTFGVIFLLAELAVVPKAIEMMLNQHLSYLPPMNLLALALTFASIALCILMTFSTLGDHGNYPLQTFLFELTVFMCCMAPVTDFATRVLDVSGRPALNMFVNTVYYLICINITYVIMLYEFSVIKASEKPQPKILKRAAFTLMLIDNIATLLNIRFGFFFTIAENGKYQSAPTVGLAYIAPALILAATVIVAAKFMNRGRQQKSFMFFWIFALVASLLQIWRGELSVQYMGFTMSLIVLYMNIQSELDTTCDNISVSEVS